MVDLGSLKQARVLVVGDCMIDRYWWGTVDRISPEAPVPVVQLDRTSVVAGGAANVAANIAGLGAEPILVGVCGNDAEAVILKESVEHRGVSSRFLMPTNDRPTTIKTRIVAHGQHVVRIDQENSQPIDRSIESDLIATIGSSINDCSAVILSDYAKGVLTDSLIRSVIDMASSASIRCFVDPKGRNFDKYRRASVITPNRLEAAIACGLPVTDVGLVDQAGEGLIRNLGCEAVLITQGEHGMTLFNKNGTKLHMESKAREVFDVTGAGDTVIATFATAAAAGATLAEAADLANMAAGIVVGTVGTTTITNEQLEHAVATNPNR